MVVQNRFLRIAERALPYWAFRYFFTLILASRDVLYSRPHVLGSAVRCLWCLLECDLANAASRSRGVECNCCGWRGNRFYPFYFAGVTREDAVCPKCGSVERNRLFQAYVARKALLFPEASVLDIAPTELFTRYCRRQRARYVSIDLTSRLAMVLMDFQALGIKSCSFDVVFCCHVLEHVKDDVACLKEAFRVLKPGAKGVFQIPVDTTRERTVDYPDANPVEAMHFRRYGADCRERLASVGFEVTVDGFSDGIDPRLLRKHGLKGSDPVYICQKPSSGGG